jgi:hypothetical protein
MTDGYARWLIAKGNVFAPAATTVMKFVDKLREEGWILAPDSPELAKLRFDDAAAEMARATGGYAVRTIENELDEDDDDARLVANVEPLPKELTREWLDHPSREELRLVWPVSAAGKLPVKYPLSMKPDGDVSFTFEIHRALEYVYPASDTITPLETLCSCGEELEFEWDEDELIPAFTMSNGIFAECDECSRTFDPAKGTARIEDPFGGGAEEVRGGAAYRFAIKVDCGSYFVEDKRLAFAPELVAFVEKELGRNFYEVGTLY